MPFRSRSPSLRPFAAAPFASRPSGDPNCFPKEPPRAPTPHSSAPRRRGSRGIPEPRGEGAPLKGKTRGNEGAVLMAAAFMVCFFFFFSFTWCFLRGTVSRDIAIVITYNNNQRETR